MYRKFYSYNDMPVIKTQSASTPVKNTTPAPKKTEKNIFSALESDDLILLAVFFILIMDNCEDRLLLLALAFVFFSDAFNQ